MADPFGSIHPFTERNQSQYSQLAFVKRHCLFNISSPNQTQKAAVHKGEAVGAVAGRWTPGSVMVLPQKSWVTSSGYRFGSPISESEDQ